MNMEEKIKRINELYHKSQDVGLTDEEKTNGSVEYIVAIDGIAVITEKNNKNVVYYTSKLMHFWV